MAEGTIRRAQAEADMADTGHDASIAPRARRVPSVFASAIEDHFSHGMGAEPGTVEEHAVH